MQISNELSRYAVNCVIRKDFKTPLEIKEFLNELHSSYQLFNFKNDNLRRKFDSIKYDIKKIEEIVYDLTINNLKSNQ
jgi:predicted translin family RNA/ssDNA-binding protein